MKRFLIIVAALLLIVQIKTVAFPVSGDESKRSLNSLILGLENGNKGLKVSCALTLGEYGFEDATEALGFALKYDSDPDVKFAAMISLYKIRTKDSVKELISAIENLEEQSLKNIAEVLLSDIMRDEDAGNLYMFND